ncbi:MAG TPA: cytidine deaminase [Actinomycetota bacterium]
MVDDAALDRAVEAARDAMGRAYAPYSGFRVGAAIVSGGAVHTGQNIEIASYPISVCAERNAIAAMVDAGDRRIDAVAVVTEADRPTPPCGGCRQALWEFGPEAVVVAATTSGERRRWTLRELLPDAFGPADLGR